jgi:hypothetical protein
MKHLRALDTAQDAINGPAQRAGVHEARQGGEDANGQTRASEAVRRQHTSQPYAAKAAQRGQHRNDSLAARRSDKKKARQDTPVRGGGARGVGVGRSNEVAPGLDRVLLAQRERDDGAAATQQEEKQE